MQFNKHLYNTCNFIHKSIETKEEAQFFIDKITFEIYLETLQIFNFYNEEKKDILEKQYKKLFKKCLKILNNNL